MPSELILLVDDEPSITQLARMYLERDGYRILEIADGESALAEAAKQKPALIVLDVMLPKVDGFDVCRRLRSAGDDVPIIMLTARDEDIDKILGLELGADDYLTKPFMAAELLATVNTRLEKRAQFDRVTERRMEDLRGNIILALPHELRTPLNVILGFSDLLMTDASLMDGVRISDMARHINSAGMRLYRLIENFLTYAQTELLVNDPAKREALQHGFLIYPTMSIENHARSKAQIIERAEDLSFALEDVEAIGISEEYLKKIVEELVDNAAKFSDAGTPINVTGEIDNGHYLICVSDQGRGMTPEQIANIGAYMQFERRLYEQQGSGLGLVLCKRLVELHTGEFTLQSVPDQGTRACVRLPIRHGVMDSQ